MSEKPATPFQLMRAAAIAAFIGMTGADFEKLCERLWHKPPTELSAAEAERLIAMLAAAVRRD